mgnify:CR=1 FL=1
MISEHEAVLDTTGADIRKKAIGLEFWHGVRPTCDAFDAVASTHVKWSPPEPTPSRASCFRHYAGFGAATEAPLMKSGMMRTSKRRGVEPSSTRLIACRIAAANFAGEIE